MSTPRPRVLIVDDEEAILELLEYNLKKEGFEVVRAADGRTALATAFQQDFQLIILDLMLPDMDGLDICRQLRTEARTKAVPLIMLTARSEVPDRIAGLDLGADDYMTKPFHAGELMARVRAALRRKQADKAGAPIRTGNLLVDESRFLVEVDGTRVELTQKEFQILTCLLRNRGKVLTRNQILDEVWGYDYFGEARTIDVHIRRLRQKMDGMRPRLLTVRGLGYKIEE